MASRIFYLIFGLFTSMQARAAEITDIRIGQAPSGSIISSDFWLIEVLSMVQGFLLKVVLPIVLVGSGLYIAYELFTAEGDETKMKNAWKSVSYSAIALVMIALSYAIIAILSNLNL